jgi:hypothetical protein
VSTLYQRAYKLQVDNVVIEGGGAGEQRFGLSISFEVEKTGKSEPNKAKIEIRNLSKDTQGSLEKRFKEARAQRVPVIVELSAGYGTDIGIIFKGDVRSLSSRIDGTETVTTIIGGDGAHNHKTARISRSFAPGTSVETVARACADALGVGQGNLGDVVSRFRLGGMGATFPEGIALSGSAKQALENISKSCGYEFSIQSGALQFTERGKPIDREILLLSPDSGLVGSPEPQVDATVLGKDGKPKPAKSGGLKIRTLLLHQLYPNARIQLDAEGHKGQVFATQVRFVGDIASNDWNNEMVVRPVNG